MNKAFLDLSEQFFIDHGLKDPVEAARLWKEWIAKPRKRSEQAKYRKVLELASGLSTSSVRHYLEGRSEKLGEQTRLRLADISKALGQPLPEEPPELQSVPKRSLRRVALVVDTELPDLPSPTYHLEIIHRILLSALRRHIATALFEVSRQPQLSIAIERILRTSRSDAIIMLRLTPDHKSLQILERAGVPTILVHADKTTYPTPPILANIVPFQEPLEQLVRGWVHNLPKHPELQQKLESKEQPYIVVVAMPDEDNVSIRTQRKYLINKGLEGFNWVVRSVPDYSFRHALDVFQKYPDAQAYVCLSDQIAVGIKHLLIATGKSHRNRIIGFDDSDLAKQENLTSFGQQLEKIGDLAIEKLVAWFGGQSEWKKEPLGFEEIQTDMYLVQRE